MIIEVCLIIITVCLVLLVLVALGVGIGLTKNLNKTLIEVGTTLNKTTTALSSLNELTISIKGKVDATDPLFNSLEKVGQITESFLSTPREVKLPKFISFPNHSNHEKEKFDIATLVEWVGLGIILWQQIKKKVSQ